MRDATLAALTGAKDSSRLPGRDELMRWETPSGWALRKVGQPVFRWVQQRPATLGRPCSSSASPPFYFCPREGGYSREKCNPKPRRVGNEAWFLKKPAICFRPVLSSLAADHVGARQVIRVASISETLKLIPMLLSTSLVKLWYTSAWRLAFMAVAKAVTRKPGLSFLDL